MRASLLLLLFSGVAAAQAAYVVQKTTSLSSAAEVITVQQIAQAPGGRIIEFRSAYIDCSATCDVTIERDGTAATTTALATVPVNARDLASKATAYSSSNVGSGTVLSVATIQAGGALGFDLSGISINKEGGTSSNLTVRTSSITGTVHISIKWTERQ